MSVRLQREDGRPSLEAQFLRFALDLRRHSTCRRMRVGCVITDLSMTEVFGFGYNGRAHDLPNGCARDEVGACGCFVGSTPVVATGIRAAFRREYHGDVVRVVTRTQEFTATPNHPVLTFGTGWVAAERLTKGDQLLNAVGGEFGLTGAPQDDQRVTLEQVYDACASAGLVVRRAGAAHDFHGDGAFDQDVGVVLVADRLRIDAQMGSFECL